LFLQLRADQLAIIACKDVAVRKSMVGLGNATAAVELISCWYKKLRKNPYQSYLHPISCKA